MEKSTRHMFLECNQSEKVLGALPPQSSSLFLLFLNRLFLSPCFSFCCRPIKTCTTCCIWPPGHYLNASILKVLKVTLNVELLLQRMAAANSFTLPEQISCSDLTWKQQMLSVDPFGILNNIYFIQWSIRCHRLLSDTVTNSPINSFAVLERL